MLFWMVIDGHPILNRYKDFVGQFGGATTRRVDSRDGKTIKIRIDSVEWQMLGGEPYVVIYLSNPAYEEDRVLLRLYADKVVFHVDHRASVIRELGLMRQTYRHRIHVFPSYSDFETSPFGRILTWIEGHLPELQPQLPAADSPSPPQETRSIVTRLCPSLLGIGRQYEF